MCGLIGIATPDFCLADFKALETGLFLNVSRGDEGTGVGVIKANGEMLVIKTGQNALDFVHTKSFQDLKNITGPAILIGHTRKAVFGGKGKRVAHPFRVNETILAHNGLLMNYRYIKRRYDLKPQTDNDTEVLTMFLDEHGLKRMDEWSGTFALSFFYDNRLHLYRDLSGDLVLGKTKSNRYIWTSEMDDLRFIFIHCGYTGTVADLPKETLWSLSLKKYPNIKKKKQETLRSYRTEWERESPGREIMGFHKGTNYTTMGKYEKCENCHVWGYDREWYMELCLWVCPDCMEKLTNLRDGKSEEEGVSTEKDDKEGAETETRGAFSGKEVIKEVSGVDVSRETMLLSGIKDKKSESYSGEGKIFLPDPTAVGSIYCYPTECKKCPDWVTCEVARKYHSVVRGCPRLVKAKMARTAELIKVSLTKKKKSKKVKSHRR